MDTLTCVICDAAQPTETVGDLSLCETCAASVRFRLAARTVAPHDIVLLGVMAEYGCGCHWWHNGRFADGDPTTDTCPVHPRFRIRHEDLMVQTISEVASCN